MQTQVIRKSAVGVPWLERDTPQGGLDARVSLETFPFTIGRQDTADLQVDSNNVSRQHAHILAEGDVYRIEDLGSTNGTFVNGERLESALLGEGDLLTFADADFCFHTGRPDEPRDTATQVMGLGPTSTQDGLSPADVIREVRRMHEALTHRGLANFFFPVVDIEQDRIVGLEAGHEDRHDSDPQRIEQRLLETECRLTARIRTLRRMLAVEEALDLSQRTNLLVRLHPLELGSTELAESLIRLHETLCDRHDLTVVTPYATVCDTPYFQTLCGQLRESGISIAWSDVAGSTGPLSNQSEITPDLLLLAPRLLEGMVGGGEPRGRVQSIVQAGKELGAKVIATGICRKSEAEACREVGIRLGQGPLFGGPRTITALLDDLARRSDSSGERQEDG